MNFKLINKTNTPINEGEIKQILDYSNECLKLTEKIEIEILIVDKNEIQGLNRQYRKIDKPTDVLSFPQPEIPGKLKFIGSIVISPEILKAKDESLEEVVKHGLLHLLGYDHEKDEATWNEKAQQIDCSL